MPFRIDVVPAEATYELRRRVLRDGRPDATVAFAQDEVEGAFHLAASDDAGAVVGIASFAPEPTSHRPGVAAWRLRGMAVDPSVQGHGVGTALLDEALRRLQARGAEVVWANGRDSALRFYRRHGWLVVGHGFVTTGDVQLPHHVVVYDIPST